MKALNLIGKRFGRLTVIKRVPTNKIPTKNKKNSYWECLCNCGKTKTVRGQHLLSKNVRSCGCLAKEVSSRIHKKHGLEHTKSYRVWHAMIARCYSKKADSYRFYGGKGVTVCKHWRYSVESFYKDMGECPDGMSIERIDTYGNYCPENCKWATRIEQANNKRNTVIIEAMGEKKSLKDWSDKTGISRSALYQRLRLGWNAEDVITFPVMERIKYKSRKNKQNLLNGNH